MEEHKEYKNDTIPVEPIDNYCENIMDSNAEYTWPQKDLKLQQVGLALINVIANALENPTNHNKRGNSTVQQSFKDK